MKVYGALFFLFGKKKANGKKLEKYEQDFYRKNIALCDVKKPEEKKKAEDVLMDMFDMLEEEK